MMVKDPNRLINRINEKIAIYVSSGFGTMWCAYAFFLMALLPIFNKNLESVIVYISSAIIQLVALPLITVSQNVLSRKAEKRSIEDHLTLLRQFEEIKSINMQQSHALEDIHKIMDDIKKIKEQSGVK